MVQKGWNRTTGRALAAAALVAGMVMTGVASGQEVAEDASLNEARAEIEAQVAAMTPEEQVAFRQENMRAFANGVSQASAFLRGEAELSAAQEAVAAMAAVAPHLAVLFPEGTAVGVSDSRALPIIWEDPEPVQELMGDAQMAIAALHEAIQSGDEAAVGETLPTVNRACAACHSRHRGPAQD